MKKILKNIFLLLILGIMIYSFRSELGNAWGIFRHRYFPCKDPIYYSLGVFDERFGITREEFLASLSDAESIWEKPINKNLFEYKEGGKLKINLIYDTRQEVTDKLQKIDAVVVNSKESYNQVKAQYEALKKEYEKDKKTFEARLKVFNDRKTAYESEVQHWNSLGGASKTEYDRLQKEQEWLRTEGLDIANLQDVLNFKVDDLNSLAGTLNKMASSLNIDVAKFNEVSTAHGGEFEEGTYERDSSGERINIFQFDNKGKLMRVLAHELGHALGLEHIEDPKAIMYRLNNGVNQSLTENDITEVKKRCGMIKE